MSMLPHSSHLPSHHRGFNRLFDDMQPFRGLMNRPPYWLFSGDNLDVANAATEITNDAKKFSVHLNVSHFKPEELKVNLDGRVITVEGNHELKDEHSFMQRSFVRKWTLPEDCDLKAVKTVLTAQGYLEIEAPKVGASASAARNIPIEQRH